MYRPDQAHVELLNKGAYICKIETFATGLEISLSRVYKVKACYIL